MACLARQRLARASSVGFAKELVLTGRMVNADEALSILESRSDISLLFTDIQMPGSLDGLKLAHAAHSRWPHIKIILVSGQIAVTEADKPDDSKFFAKPLEVQQMIHELQEMVGKGALKVMLSLTADDARTLDASLTYFKMLLLDGSWSHLWVYIVGPLVGETEATPAKAEQAFRNRYPSEPRRKNDHEPTDEEPHATRRERGQRWSRGLSFQRAMKAFMPAVLLGVPGRDQLALDVESKAMVFARELAHLAHLGVLG